MTATPATRKVVLIAPFWRHAGHVGNLRVRRFVRWLKEVGHAVVIVRAGVKDGVCEGEFGPEITVRDPLGLNGPDEGKEAVMPSPGRKPNRARRYLAYFLLSPDPGIVWAWRAAKHELVLKYGKDANYVLSSSPPESAHVAAARLARFFGARLIVDMRDGWLDEPLKPILQASTLRRWREGRLESKALTQAFRIFVTSRIWKEMLHTRLPFLSSKTIILTNGYSPVCAGSQRPLSKDGLILLHAGRLSGSSQTRTAGLLLDCLRAGIESDSRFTGTISFLGDLSATDLADIRRHQDSFSTLGWELKTESAVPREEMFSRIAVSNGLLLLSASRAAIPSKAFEYIYTRKPVLAVCPKGSSVWEMAEELPQFFCCDYLHSRKSAAVVRQFLKTCEIGCAEAIVPSQYRDEELKSIFLRELSPAL